MDFTMEQIKSAVPRQFKSYINEDFVNELNTIDDSEIAEHFKQSMVDYISVLQEGKIKISSYINAVKFATYKHYGYTNQDAYCKIFPEKVQSLKDEGRYDSLSSYVSAFANTKTVVAVIKQTLIPEWILNVGTRQETINFLVSAMQNEKASWTARVKAADVIMTHTAPPEDRKLTVDIGISNSDEIVNMQATINQLAEQQKTFLELGGTSLRSIVESNIIDVEAEHVYD